MASSSKTSGGGGRPTARNSFVAGSVKFGSQGTYNGEKRIMVEARQASEKYAGTVLELRRRRDAGPNEWEIVVPARTWAGETPRSIARPRSLREQKGIAERLIMNARTPERIRGLLTATKAPRWATKAR